MRRTVLLAAALALPRPSLAKDVPIAQAVSQLAGKERFLLDNYNANMQLRIDREKSAEKKKYLQSSEFRQYAQTFIDKVHKDVLAQLQARAARDPNAVVSDKEVENYVNSFKGQLLELRKTIDESAGQRRSGVSNADAWPQILAKSQEGLQRVVAQYADPPHDTVGPVPVTKISIETVLGVAQPQQPGTSPSGVVTNPSPSGSGASANSGNGTTVDGGNVAAASPASAGPQSGSGAAAAPLKPADSAAARLALADVDGARQDLNHAAENGTADADAYALRGELAMNDGRFSAAYNDAKRALEMDPKNQSAMAVLQFSKGRYDGAPPDQSASAAGAAPGSAGAAGGSSSAGSSSAGSGGAAGAIAAANGVPSSSALSRLSGEQARTAAQSALGMNDLAGARAYVDRALAQDPGNPALLNLRAMISARGRDFARAEADARAGLTIAPKDPALLRTLGYAQVRNKDYRDAIATANSMMERDPNDAYAYALRAHAYGSMGDRDAMMADLKRAAELDPSFRAAAAKMESQLELPKDADVLFLFPGETAPAAAPAAPPASPAAGRGVLLGAGAAGVLLLAGALLLARKRPEPESEAENGA